MKSILAFFIVATLLTTTPSAATMVTTCTTTPIKGGGTKTVCTSREQKSMPMQLSRPNPQGNRPFYFSGRR